MQGAMFQNFFSIDTKQLEYLLLNHNYARNPNRQISKDRKIVIIRQKDSYNQIDRQIDRQYGKQIDIMAKIDR